MTVERFVSQMYSSNIYLLEETNSDFCWLVDIGDKKYDLPYDKIVKGVFITHTHIDHIQGINNLLGKFPDCVIYVNAAGKEGLFDDRINLTYYHETPLCFQGGDVRIIKDGDVIELFRGCYMEVFETPGHAPSCVCYGVCNYLFTGDSYIPGFPVVTKLKGGNKSLAHESEERIKSLIREKTILCPGHGEMKCKQSKIGY